MIERVFMENHPNQKMKEDRKYANAHVRVYTVTLVNLNCCFPYRTVRLYASDGRLSAYKKISVINQGLYNKIPTC